MEKKKKAAGRPMGTTQNGTSTPRQKLKILRSKAWAWACSYYLSDDQNKYVSQDITANEANAFVSSPKNEVLSYDSGYFSKRRRGIEGVTPETVYNLWSEVQNAYFVGPWVDDGSEGTKLVCGGVFVPLWSAISGEMEQLREDWFKIPIKLWEKWDPDHMQEKYFFGVTEKASGRRSSFQDLYEMACRLSQPSKNIPPLVSFTACLTAARICGDKKILLFEPDMNISPFPVGRQSRYIILSAMRDRLFENLLKVGISFQEIIDVASGYGLTIYDSCTLGDLGDDFSLLVAEMEEDLTRTAAQMGVDANLFIADNSNMLAYYIYEYLCNERETMW